MSGLTVRTMETIVALAVPRPIPVGAEMAALARFYPNVTWSGRIVEGGLRELVISFGRSGYLALYRFVPARREVRILAIRHQRELDYP